MTSQELMKFGVTMPRSFVERLDTLKGPYMTRNKFMLKMLTEHLDEKWETTKK